MNFPTDICMTGATGLVGNELLLLLSALEHVGHVTVLSRKPLGRFPAKIENILLDFDKLQHYGSSLKAHTFVCCLGTTIKVAGSQEAFRKVDYDYVIEFAKVAEKVGAQKFMVISAMGANPESSVFYNRVKGEMERDLRKLAIPQIEIFRPSLLTGNRKEHRTGEVIAQKLSPIINTFMVGPLKKYKAIAAKDVAKAMALAIMNFNEGQFIYESDEIQRMSDSIKSDV
ncbi:NAD(P)H-binding protein [Bdellovibrio sp. SKB1291214]|uniref:NAD(P)H-binding protein n=1 Tax=Bdellovibrio sp. SKB1291214 TaxID=1732569 RepID=UPI000B51B6D0|nr:NAD(P)H-binding protein [Bdellovibrio sp. SKB1291214]UYL09657.1 NAD(P)H-binding protein [Bdellovibrio sp. SKB1291214]